MEKITIEQLKNAKQRLKKANGNRPTCAFINIKNTIKHMECSTTAQNEIQIIAKAALQDALYEISEY